MPIHFVTTRPTPLVGEVVIVNDQGSYAKLQPDALWTIGDCRAQESVAQWRRRFFHTFCGRREDAEALVIALKAYWDAHHAAAQGAWDLDDALILCYGGQHLVLIHDMVFDNAAALLAFCDNFDADRGVSPENALPTAHLRKSSYRWPISGQTLRDTFVAPVLRSAVGSEPYNTVVVDYEGELGAYMAIA